MDNFFERKTNLVNNLNLCSSQPYLRVSVDDRGDAVVVDVDWPAEHALAGDHGLVLGLVGQHRAVDAVADRVHVRDHSLGIKTRLDKPILNLRSLY